MHSSVPNKSLAKVSISSCQHSLISKRNIDSLAYATDISKVNAHTGQ
jgi:hypothetical protein